MTKRKLKPGNITNKKVRLQELNTNKNPTKRDIVDVGKNKRVPPTTKKNYTYKNK